MPTSTFSPLALTYGEGDNPTSDGSSSEPVDGALELQIPKCQLGGAGSGLCQLLVPRLVAGLLPVPCQGRVLPSGVPEFGPWHRKVVVSACELEGKAVVVVSSCCLVAPLFGGWRYRPGMAPECPGQ